MEKSVSVYNGFRFVGASFSGFGSVRVCFQDFEIYIFASAQNFSLQDTFS